jgi:purine-binding chemotaxis protein CheW
MLNPQTEGSLENTVEGSQYLTFVLAEEEYGVDILKVQEIRGWEQATRIPGTPEFVLGVINLRGSVVPIIDLRKRFELVDKDFNKLTVMILVNVLHEGSMRTIGMVVDSVSEVYTISDDDVNPAPEVGGAISTNYIKGLATVEDKMIILLDIDLLINTGILDDVEATDV